MSSTADLPKGLRPYAAHGLDFAEDGTDNAKSECPFCNKNKFYVHLEKSTFQCWTCSIVGNSSNFAERLHEASVAATTTEELAELATDRKILFVETLREWGVCKSITTGQWLVPGYSGSGKVGQLYRYIQDPYSTKKMLMATPELPLQLSGLANYKYNCDTIFLSEGQWDGMVLYETLKHACRQDEEHFSYTDNITISMLSNSCVLAVPGCSSFGESWAKWFKGKKIIFLYDSDHIKLHCKPCKRTWSKVLNEKCPLCQGELTPPEVVPSGLAGTKKAVGVLGASETPPESAAYLCWGEEGYWAEKPSGYDIRDLLTERS